MLKTVQGLLCCPACHGDLAWSIDEEIQERMVHTEVRCTGCSRAYAVTDEVGVFLLNETSDDDLWKVVESGLARRLRENPQYEEQLMNSDFSSLNAADKLLHTTILDERGMYDLARARRKTAVEELYPSPYREQYKAKKGQLLTLLAEENAVIVDLASGMAGLAEAFAGLESPVVFSDISPSVLFRNQKRLRHFGLYDKTSLLAFDVQRMPFRDSSIPVFTSNIGLTNIRDSKGFVQELSRCLRGRAYFITFFFPDNGDRNAQLLEQLDMELAFEDRLQKIAERHLEVEILYRASSEIKPTVQSEIFGVGIDALPVEPTTVTWAIVKMDPYQ